MKGKADNDTTVPEHTADLPPSAAQGSVPRLMTPDHEAVNATTRQSMLVGGGTVMLLPPPALSSCSRS